MNKIVSDFRVHIVRLRNLYLLHCLKTFLAPNVYPIIIYQKTVVNMNNYECKLLYKVYVNSNKSYEISL